MVQTVATLFSVLLGLSALAVIGFSLFEEWDILKRTVRPAMPVAGRNLPARTRQIAPARRARMVRINVETSPRRAAA